MWLRNHEDVSAAQIQDWLDEHYQERYKERTVRDYVAKLRMSYDLPRQQAGREYGSIPELPPGVQMQADFGFFNAERPGSSCILSFSFWLIHATSIWFGKRDISPALIWFAVWRAAFRLWVVVRNSWSLIRIA